MRFLALLALVTAAVATPSSWSDNEQLPLGNGAQLGHSSTRPSGTQLDLNALRLVQLEGEYEPVVMTELQKLELKAQDIGFFDVTETPNLGLRRAQLRAAAKPSYSSPNNTEAVRSVIKTLDIHNVRATLEKFSSFRTRYYYSESGKQSQEWLSDKVSEITKEYASKELQNRISLTEFPHPWPQSSIIIRINGTSTEDDGVVVIGAHQDSLSKVDPFDPAPGADDNGSGAMAILEVYRALLAADFHPERTVEFHWYAAEEGGLLGSQLVAQAYENEDVNVIGMSQFDTIAFVKRGTREQIGVVTDLVDPDLTEFNKKLIDMYCDIPWIDVYCGYGCSDHASWNRAGYPSVSQMESVFKDLMSPYVHSIEDVIDITDEFSFDHIHEFAKLAVAFTIELAGWSGPGSA